MRVRRRKVLLTRLAILAAVLVILEIAPRLGWVDSLTLVPPSEMISTLLRNLGSGDVFIHIFVTGLMIISSFLLAAITGTVGGFFLWRFGWLRKALDPYLTSYYALPVFAFYPVLVAIFGLNQIPIILIAWAYATVAVVTNTVIGLNSVKAVHMRTARVYGLDRWSILWHIQLPAASTHVFTGFKLAVTYAVSGVIASEFILATQGLGWLVAFNYNSFQTAQMYSSIILVVLISTMTAIGVGFVESRVWAGRVKA